MANIKVTLLSTLENGKETLNNIKVLRKLNKDNITSTPVARASDRIHPKAISLILNEIIDTNKDAKIFRFVAKDGYLPPFEAGQYINIFVNIDGILTSRPYSLSSSPSLRSYYEVTIARCKNGFVSSYFLDKAKVGDEFICNGPNGVFRYQPVFHSKKSLFLAGGSGITPFISMLREILNERLDRDIVMLYGVRNEESALYHEELSYLAATYSNFKYHLVVSNDTSYKGLTGFIDRKLISNTVNDYSERTAYICGPQIMNDFCKSELESLGLPIKQIRREMFGAKKNITEEDGWPKNITGDEVFKLTINNQVYEAKSSDSLLTTLEKLGIRVNVCCRSGECSLCRVKLVKGNVYLAKGALMRAADSKFGYIHSCKSYPISDLEIEL